jgi:hypothetical protein
MRAAEDRITALERSLAQAKDTLRAAKDAAGSAGAGSGSGSGSGGAGSGTGGSASTAPPAGDKPGNNSGGQSGVKAAEQQVRYAGEDLAKAKDALTTLKAKSGAMLPAGEVVFLSRFPARVDAVQVAVGGEVKEKALTVSAGDLVVKGQLAPHEKGLVRPGLKVKILSELSGIEAAGEVRSVADTPMSPGGTESAQGSGDGRQPAMSGGGAGYETVIAPASVLDPKLAGQDVRLTVEAASSGGPVLVVPLSAVSAGADGRTVVTVLETGGAQRRVEVRPGTSGDGFVEVAPMGGGALTEGDRVVVGAARKETSSGGGKGSKGGADDKGGPGNNSSQSGPRS